jgi:hypothetical protein
MNPTLKDEAEKLASIVKTKFKYSLTEPAMSFFIRTTIVVTKSQVDPKRRELFSIPKRAGRPGPASNSRKEAETLLGLWYAFGTCGCAVLCCGLCGKCDKNTAKLNEESYCSIMKRKIQARRQNLAYRLFGSAPSLSRTRH